MPILSTLVDFASKYTTLYATQSNGWKLLAAFIALIVFKYRSHAIGTRARPDLKGPRAFPLLGHMPLMASIPGTQLYEFFESNYEKYGPVWSISLPKIGRMTEVDTPELLEHILKTNFWSYEKGDHFRSVFWNLVGNGIFTADGHDWKHQRKLMGRIFTVNAFKEYISDVFVTEGQKVIDYLAKAADEGTVVDFQLLMQHFALDAIGTVSFSESFKCLDDVGKQVPFASAFDELLSFSAMRVVDPLWKIHEKITGRGKKAQNDQDIIAAPCYRLMEKRRREGFHGTKRDLLQWFLEAKDDEGNHLPDDLIKDMLISITVAGRDTTASSMAWMFYSLHCTGADPDVLKKLVHEVDDVLQDGLPSYETYKQQKFSEACFHESLRLHPAVPRNLKICVQDDVLPDGTKIYAGEWVTWSPYVMGRSKTIWGEDAREFKPSRWINTEKPSQGKFNAFHVGPRVCLGQQFATVQVMTMIAMILSKFTIELVHPDKLPPYGVSFALSMLEGLPIRVHHRADKAKAPGLPTEREE
ncbi:hypothetical protein BG005_002043 [Podila minutissima]|nr:hypothetical protein BG005_002043 [Podila minutissima]